MASISLSDRAGTRADWLSRQPQSSPWAVRSRPLARYRACSTRPAIAIGACLGIAVQLNMAGRGRSHDRERHGSCPRISVAVCTELHIDDAFRNQFHPIVGFAIAPQRELAFAAMRHVLERIALHFREGDGLNSMTEVSSSICRHAAMVAERILLSVEQAKNLRVHRRYRPAPLAWSLNWSAFMGDFCHLFSRSAVGLRAVREHSVTVNQYINRASEVSKLRWHICGAFQ